MHDDRIDIDAIDIRTLTPEQWDALLRLAARRARIARSQACQDLVKRGWRGALAWARRMVSAGNPAASQVETRAGRSPAATQL